MHYTFINNGFPSEADYSDQSVQDIFLPLLKHLQQLQKDKGRRILVYLAAPPAAGKTTLVHFLKDLAGSIEGYPKVTSIGMDGFHHYQDWLLTHMEVKDGRTIKLVEVKGAPETFDLERLTDRIRKAASGMVCGWPEYDRAKHNPREDAACVDGDIVLLEGNYLLLDLPGWRDLKQYADYTISILADPAFLRNRLIERKKLTVPREEDAVHFVDCSDMKNVELCLTRSQKADLELWLKENNDYTLQ